MSASEVTAGVTAYWEARAPYFNGTASHVCTPDCTSRGLPPPPDGACFTKDRSATSRRSRAFSRSRSFILPALSNWRPPYSL